MSHISKITRVEELTLKQLISLKRFILGKEVIGNECPHCTAYVRDYTKYCSKCGQRLYWCKHYIIDRKNDNADVYEKLRMQRELEAIKADRQTLQLYHRGNYILFYPTVKNNEVCEYKVIITNALWEIVLWETLSKELSEELYELCKNTRDSYIDCYQQVLNLTYSIR